METIEPRRLRRLQNCTTNNREENQGERSDA
jgi:hypothetical protein